MAVQEEKLVPLDPEVHPPSKKRFWSRGGLSHRRSRPTHSGFVGRRVKEHR
jgi:hypothetical protein